MSDIVSYNGQTFTLNSQGDPAPWGDDQHDLILGLIQGSLVQNGDNFTLTAEGDFGAQFGIKSLYLKSRSSNIATSGIVRLSATDSVSFGTSNYALTTDGSGNLTWRGNKVAGSSSPVTSITGTANQVIASASTGDVTLSTPQDIGTSSAPTFASETLAATSNQLVLGATRTVTLTAPTPASASRTVSIPDLSASYSVVGTEGTQTINGNKTLSGTINLSALTLSLPLQLDASKNIVSAAINLSTGAVTGQLPLSSGVSGTLAVGNGGTGQTTYTNGQLLIGNTTGNTLAKATLTGTANSLTVTNGSGSITLSTPITSAATYTLPATRGTNGFFLQTDGTTDTLVWASGGSGTVTSGTANRLAYYAASNSTISSLAGITGNKALASDANGLPVASTTTDTELGYIHALAAISATAGTITTADSLNSAMGKIINARVVQVVTGTTTTQTTTTSSTFASTSLSAAISPKASGNTILVIASGALGLNSANNTANAAIFEGSTNLGDTTLGSAYHLSQDSSTNTHPCTMIAFHSPATTSATTYTVKVRSANNSATANWGNGETQLIILVEIGA